jgi:hypothetical protein
LVYSFVTKGKKKSNESGGAYDIEEKKRKEKGKRWYSECMNKECVVGFCIWGRLIACPYHQLAL